jgi:predicted PurR-regulated permease PerM
LLSPVQRRIAGAALTLLAVLGIAALLGLGVVALGRLLAHFGSVLWPLATAGVLALMLRPWVGWLEARLRVSRLGAVIILYALFTGVVAGALLLAAPSILGQIVDLLAYLPKLAEKLSGYVQTSYPEWKALADREVGLPLWTQLVEKAVEEAKGLLAHAWPSLRTAFGGVSAAATFLTGAAVVPVYLFFFLLAAGFSTRGLGEHLPFLSPTMREDVVFLVGEFVSIVEAFFRGQLLIALAMGVLLALGFSLIGLKFGALNVIPYLGSILGLAVALPLAFFQAPDGGWLMVGLVLLVKVAVQTIEGWVLTPRIMGRQTGLHPVAIIFAVFFWGTALGGLLGMLLAIPLTAFVVTAWRLVRRKYFASLHAA